MAGGVASGGKAPRLSSTERVCAELAEQFVLDVGSTTPAQRAAVTQALGGGTLGFVQVLYAIDSRLRVRAAIRQVFGAETTLGCGAESGGTSLWPALEMLMTAVGRLNALDPVTTELVRLRGARTHDCRLCKSRRSVVAVDEGANEVFLDQIDRYEASDLSARHKVALRLTDAMIWQPATHPPGLSSDIQANFSPAEALEIIFDVARNAANKIAVTLGADQANVTEGVEYFDTDANGDLVVGVTPGRRG
jgi:alkylhydroperoxidase family enzyme